jgi:hypothetical protein
MELVHNKNFHQKKLTPLEGMKCQLLLYLLRSMMLNEITTESGTSIIIDFYKWYEANPKTLVQSRNNHIVSSTNIRGDYGRQ